MLVLTRAAHTLNKREFVIIMTRKPEPDPPLPHFLPCFPVQSPEDKVPVWYVMDEFGSQVRHSDQPTCSMAPFFYVQGQLAYTVLWPLQDLHEGGESAHSIHGAITMSQFRK